MGPGGKVLHINRDNLCGPCATLLRKVLYEPAKLLPEDWDWFNKQCEHNKATGKFIPVAQRRSKEWSCKKCGKTGITNQDNYYIQHCIECADTIRHSRSMPDKSKRKERSDKGKTR